MMNELEFPETRPTSCTLVQTAYFQAALCADSAAGAHDAHCPPLLYDCRDRVPPGRALDVDICEGYNASSRDVRRLSEKFGTPVLAFSIFDSDILFVSYSDAAQNISYDCAKPNIEGMEEYDTGLYQAEFPHFLLELCPEASEETLREIWDGDEVFADDRMGKLCQALGAVPFFYEKIPEGFEAVTP